MRKRLIRAPLGENAAELDTKTGQTIDHYPEHNEHEMALNGLCIDLMKIGMVTSTTDLSEYMALLRHPKLDLVSIFDADFRPKFLGFVHMVTDRPANT